MLLIYISAPGVKLTYNFQGDTPIHSPWHLHRRRHSGADHERIPRISNKATCLHSLEQVSAAHLLAGFIRVSAPRTSPGECGLRAKPDAHHIYHHLRDSEYNPLVRFLPHLSAKYLVQIWSIRTMRVRRESHGHSELGQYVYFHLVRGPK